jgi:hypothetical protein
VTVGLQFSLSTFFHLIFEKTLLFWQKLHTIQIRFRITTDRSSQFIILRQMKDNSNYEMTKRLDHTKYGTLHWEKTRECRWPYPHSTGRNFLHWSPMWWMQLFCTGT